MGKVILFCFGLVFIIFSYQVIAQQQEVLPFLESIPRTTFSCKDRIYGYYADLEANCQVFHICLTGRKWSFLCPNQTKFNQEFLVCDYPNNVDCSVAEKFYNVNENFGKVETTSQKS